MNRILVIVATILVLVGLGIVTAPDSRAAAEPPRSEGKPQPIPGELIVGFDKGLSKGVERQALDAAGVAEKAQFARIGATLVQVEPGNAQQAMKKLQGDPRVRYVEPNYRVSASRTTNDPSFDQLWGLTNTGQDVNGYVGVPDADIDAEDAWDVTQGSTDVVVAVIDTGVDFSHPDLGGSMTTSPVMWINAGENCGGCRTDRVDNDGNGYVDDWRGWDFVNGDNNPRDDFSHGTHVAGTIGALGDNSRGITGVNWRVKIMSLKFLGADGSGTTADAVSAVLYAADEGAFVTNNSWGGPGFSQALKEAIETADTAGSLFVAAAGNDSTDNDSSPTYPSSYEVPNLVSVAATNSSDELAGFSNYGRRSVDLGAPGENVYSTVLGGGYDYYSGTSMATPHVAGAAALVKAAFPEATHLGAKALLLRSIDPVAALTGRTTAEGRLNLNTAVRCADAPKLWIDSSVTRAAVGEPIALRLLAANCARPDAAVTATANGRAIALTERGDGLYTGSFAPTEAGPLTIEASAAVAGATDTRSISVTVLGENPYRFADAPFRWLDATVRGTNSGIASDDVSVPVALPFPFAYHGQTFDSVSVSSNGYLVFGPDDASAFENAPLPTEFPPNGIVAPLWDDLNPGVGGAVFYRTFGAAPNRRFVVEWADVPGFPASGAVTFEVVLEEGTNDILFQYRDLDFGDYHDNGGSASVGVEDLEGLTARQFSFESPTLQPYVNQKAIRFSARPVNTSRPTIEGLAEVGQVLHASRGTWDGAPTSFAYDWLACNATGSECVSLNKPPNVSWHTVRPEHAGKTFRATVTACSSSGCASATSAPTAIVREVGAPQNTSRPTITGRAEVGQVLRARTGSWSGSPTGYAYEWFACNPTGGDCVSLHKPPNVSWHTVRAADAGKTLRVAVEARNGAGRAWAVSVATGVVPG